MDHYIPKRRIPVTLWSNDLHGVQGSIFLDLDAAGNRHQTVLEKLNESTRFLPMAVGEEGRIHLFNKHRVTRVTIGRRVIQSDVFARGFTPWREEQAEVLLNDGTTMVGLVWMPLQRESQRLSDFMNQQGWEFFALLTPLGVHLINTAAVVGLQLAESAGAPLAEGQREVDGSGSPAWGATAAPASPSWTPPGGAASPGWRAVGGGTAF